jgi:hypothetical protein
MNVNGRRPSGLLLLGLVASLAGVSAAPFAQQPQPAPGAIVGVVVDAVTGRPVTGARVSLRRVETLDPGPRVLTDARGRFVFAGLPAAKDYFLGASRFGYATTRYGWNSPNGSLAVSAIRRIAVSEGQIVSDIKVPLWRLGSISGRVVDEAGEPVVGVVVRAFTMANIAGQPQPVAGELATTDDRGVYRLPDISPGRYVVSVLSVQSTVLSSTPEVAQQRPVGELASGGIGGGRGAVVASPGIDVDGQHRLVLSNFATPPPPGRGEARAYPAVFFPAASSAADAAPIDIGYGDTREAVDFQLRPVRAVRVSGRLDAGVLAPPRFLLRLLPKGSEQLGFGAEAATTQVEANGAFTFLNVPAGEYTLIAQGTVMDFDSTSDDRRLPDAPGFPAGGISVGSKPGAPGLGYLVRGGQSEPAWGRLPLSVGDRDLTGVLVPMHPAAKIRGHLVFAEGVKPPQGPFLLFAQPANGDPSLGNPSGRTAPNDPAHAFEVAGLLAGTYLLDPLSFGSMAPVSVICNGRDLKDAGFDGSLGGDFDDVVVTLTNRFAEISGVVSDAGRAAAGAVIVFPVEREQWVNYGWEPLRLQSTPVASDGTYRAQRVPEGDYLVIAVDSAHSDAWLNQKFLAAAAPLAKHVSVKWGDRTSLDMSITDVVIK